jgi:hypothetical protein
VNALFSRSCVNHASKVCTNIPLLEFPLLEDWSEGFPQDTLGADEEGWIHIPCSEPQF